MFLGCVMLAHPQFYYSLINKKERALMKKKLGPIPDPAWVKIGTLCMCCFGNEKVDGRPCPKCHGSGEREAVVSLKTLANYINQQRFGDGRGQVSQW